MSLQHMLTSRMLSTVGQRIDLQKTPSREQCANLTWKRNLVTYAPKLITMASVTANHAF